MEGRSGLTRHQSTCDRRSRYKLANVEALTFIAPGVALGLGLYITIR